jgi:phosphoesterase RecJ-like protein
MTTALTQRSLTDGDIAAVPADVVTRIREARRVLTVCHENPEADALGSAAAVAIAVETLGGVATAVCADPVPRMYDFLPVFGRFRQEPDPAIDYDLIVVGDCGELERVGAVLPANAELFARTPIVNIDHHKSNPGFGTVDWVDPEAAATCEMDTLLMHALGVPLTAADGALASALLAGVVIDTANFQHPNTTPRTLRAAADLVAAGAPLALTARQLYRTKPGAQLKLLGMVLGRLESEHGGALVWSSLTDADLTAAGAVPAHSEGIIDLVSQAEGAEITILFKEAGPHTRISVRTRDGGADATVLTGIFGGGGHARASGATVPLPIAEARPVVLAEARALLPASASR